MEVVAPMPQAKSFHTETASSTPYVSAPSSPRAGGGGFDYLYHYTSAPASPTRITAIYSLNHQPDHHDRGGHFPVEDNDFEFNFSGQLQKGALPPELTAADELFQAGKFKTTMKQQPKSPQRAGDSRRDHHHHQRAKSNSSRARSLSPLRNQDPAQKDRSSASNSSSSSSNSIVSFLRNAGGGGGSKKWRLKDLLLFRSASEGRVTGRGSKDPLRKYTAISPPLPAGPAQRSSKGEDSKSSSFRSTDSGGSVRKGSVSPHELHYTTNRAVSEELKKKTPLPYRQGLFGCLRFNPAVTAISRSFNNQSLS